MISRITKLRGGAQCSKRGATTESEERDAAGWLNCMGLRARGQKEGGSARHEGEQEPSAVARLLRRQKAAKVLHGCLLRAPSHARQSLRPVGMGGFPCAGLPYRLLSRHTTAACALTLPRAAAASNGLRSADVVKLVDRVLHLIKAADVGWPPLMWRFSSPPLTSYHGRVRPDPVACCRRCGRSEER